MIPLPACVRALPLLLALAAGGPTLQGCSHARGPDAAAPADATELTVENHHWLDIVVYVVHDGERTRVGTVSATSSHTFALPPRLIGQGHELRLVGHPIGGSDNVVSDLLTVQPGQYIVWTLESGLERSAAGVY